jgi:hypothetical protein
MHMNAEVVYFLPYFYFSHLSSSLLQDSFWLLVATIDQHCKDFYSPDMVEIRVNSVVVGLLLRAKLKKLFLHLVSSLLFDAASWPNL